MTPLPLPPSFDPAAVDDVRPVPYGERACEAEQWARRHGIRAAAQDDVRVCLLCVDCQNTFCSPGFELYVGGRSGTGASEDVSRLCSFVYRNLASITEIVVTLDTHHAMQIFHPAALAGPDGAHPEPYTLVSVEDVDSEEAAAARSADRATSPAERVKSLEKGDHSTESSGSSKAGESPSRSTTERMKSPQIDAGKVPPATVTPWTPYIERRWPSALE